MELFCVNLCDLAYDFLYTVRNGNDNMDRLEGRLHFVWRWRGAIVCVGSQVKNSEVSLIILSPKIYGSCDFKLKSQI